MFSMPHDICIYPECQSVEMMMPYPWETFGNFISWSQFSSNAVLRLFPSLHNHEALKHWKEEDCTFRRKLYYYVISMCDDITSLPNVWKISTSYMHNYLFLSGSPFHPVFARKLLHQALFVYVDGLSQGLIHFLEAPPAWDIAQSLHEFYLFLRPSNPWKVIGIHSQTCWSGVRTSTFSFTAQRLTEQHHLRTCLRSFRAVIFYSNLKGAHNSTQYLVRALKHLFSCLYVFVVGSNFLLQDKLAHQSFFNPCVRCRHPVWAVATLQGNTSIPPYISLYLCCSLTRHTCLA